jgi:hypothetical protein
MNKRSPSAAFRKQLAQAMAELRSIIASGKPPAQNARSREHPAKKISQKNPGFTKNTSKTFTPRTQL